MKIVPERKRRRSVLPIVEVVVPGGVLNVLKRSSSGMAANVTILVYVDIFIFAKVVEKSMDTNTTIIVNTINFSLVAL